MTERPHSVELEQTLLGTILHSADAFRAVVTVARPEHFSEPVHALIFELLLEQSEAGRGFGTEAIMAALRLRWNEKLVGDVTLGQYVIKLGELSQPPAWAYRIAQDLRDLWAMRRILEAAEVPVLTDGRPVRAQLAEVFDSIDGVRASLVEAGSTRGTAGKMVSARVTALKSVVEDGVVMDSGATTGFAEIDRMMLGYRAGELVVVAARPGMGKTTWATSSLLQSARQGNGVALFSLELPEDAITARLLADAMHDWRLPLVTHSMIRGNTVPKAELLRLDEGARDIEALPFELDFSPRLSVAEIGIRAGALKKKMAARGEELRVVAIDYLKFVKATDRYKGQRVYEVGEVTAGLKEIAKELGVCILLLCQLNRGVEGQGDKRPDLQHLRESGDIESDADVVMFLYRDAYYIERSPAYRSGTDIDAQAEYAAARFKLEVILAKNRNGPCGTVELFCNIGASAIRDQDRRQASMRA